MFHRLLHIYAACIASFIARKLNVHMYMTCRLFLCWLFYSSHNVKREETCSGGGSMKSYMGNGRGVTKQRRVVEFTRSDRSLFLSLNVHYILLGK